MSQLLVIAIAVVVASPASASSSGCCVRGEVDQGAAADAGRSPAATTPPGVGDDAEVPRDTPTRADRGRRPGVDTLRRQPEVEEPELAPPPSIERPAPVGGRLQRLRARLARSNTAFGQGLLGLLSRGRPGRGGLGGGRGHAARPPTSASRRRSSWSSRCAPRSRSRAPPTRRPCGAGCARTCWPSSTRAWTARSPPPGSSSARPSSSSSGVNGTGKTTTVGKLARVLVARGQGRRPGRGRHLPRRRRRPAGDLGRARRRADGPLRPRGRRPGGRGVRRGQGAAPSSRPTSCSSTPPAGCTTRSG